jgi:hypothetical protein
MRLTCNNIIAANGGVNLERNRYGIKHPKFITYRGADKSLAPPGRKKTTATENFDVLISYL